LGWLGALALGWDVAPARAAVGAKASTFRLRAVPGTKWQGMFDLSESLKQGPVVLSFFATWCRPCEVELPVLQQHFTRLSTRGLQIVAVAIDGPESTAQIAPTVRRLGVEFPVVHDADSRVTSRYNPRRFAPFMVLIDTQGRIKQEREGWTQAHAAALPAQLEALLKPAAP